MIWQPSCLRVPHPHVEFTDFGVVVRGTRVPVYRLWFWHRRGVTFDSLWKRYPKIPQSYILDAVAFAYDNPEIIKLLEHREEALLSGKRAEWTSEEMKQIPFTWR